MEHNVMHLYIYVYVNNMYMRDDYYSEIDKHLT